MARRITGSLASVWAAAGGAGTVTAVATLRNISALSAVREIMAKLCMGSAHHPGGGRGAERARGRLGQGRGDGALDRRRGLGSGAAAVLGRGALNDYDA